MIQNPLRDYLPTQNSQMQHKCVGLRNVLVANELILCLIERVQRSFDPEAIKAQIANLVADRERIDQTIHALESALSGMENINPQQPQLRFEAEISLHEAVKQTCIGMIDAITRQRVTRAIERAYPLMRPNPSSVAASLINLSKGDHAMLKTAVEGRGSAPSVYSTEGDISIRLNSDEIESLMDESVTKGTGGWQSLWSTLQRNFDKASGQITLTPELRARIYQYYHNYGTGGWQTRTKRVFKRELPHLFLA